MHSSSLILALVALSAAQTIDWVQVDSAADPVIDTPPVNVVSQTVSVEPPAVASSVGAAAVAATPLTQRDFRPRTPALKRDGSCALQPAGTGPQVKTYVLLLTFQSQQLTEAVHMMMRPHSSTMSHLRTLPTMP